MKNNQLANIAYEISPLLTASGTDGDKSGVYRVTFNLIDAMSDYLLRAYPNVKIVLFSLIYNSTYSASNPELIPLFEKPNIIILNLQKKIELIKEDNPFSQFIPFRVLINWFNKLSIKKRLDNYQINKRFLNSIVFELQKNNVQLIHFSETGFKKLKNFKHVITINDLIALNLSSTQKAETVRIHKEKIKFAKQSCDGVIFISKCTANDYNSVKCKINLKQLTKVIYPGVKILDLKARSTFADLERYFYTKYGVTIETKKYFLYYGTFDPRKNISSLVRAFYDLDLENALNKNKLILVGGEGWGDVKNKLKSFLNEKYPINSESPILIAEFINDSYLQELIKNSRFVLYPSLYEGFGLPIIEAMQYGTPVLTADNSSLREAGGEYAQYFKSTNYDDIKEDIKKRIKYNSAYQPEKLKDYASTFNWENNVRQTYNFYRDILSD